MNNFICKPTKYELAEKLKDLEQWEPFALSLKPINQQDIDTIKKVSCDDTEDLKQNLFEKWLNTHPNPSWGLVIMALRKAGENELAQRLSDTLSHEVQIKDETVKKLSELHTSFGELSFECEKALIELVQSNELIVSHLALRVNNEVDVYGIEENLTNINSVEQFLQVISKYYNFLNYNLLLTIIKQFLNNTDLLQNLQVHAANVDSFMDTTEIQYLQKTLETLVTKSKSDVPITIRVYQAWKKQNIGLVKILLGVLSENETKNIPKLFRIISGSLTIVLLVPQHISLSLIEHSKHKIQFMRLTGIISLQIGDTYILQDEENDNYTFEQALIEGNRSW